MVWCSEALELLAIAYAQLDAAIAYNDIEFLARAARFEAHAFRVQRLFERQPALAAIGGVS